MFRVSALMRNAYHGSDARSERRVSLCHGIPTFEAYVNKKLARAYLTRLTPANRV